MNQDKLKILHISSSNIYGGSTKAAVNLHKSLLKENVHSFFLSQDNVLNLPNSLSKQSSFTNILNRINNSDCDLLNLHWICNEFISINQIKKINKPIVWSLYDI